MSKIDQKDQKGPKMSKRDPKRAKGTQIVQKGPKKDKRDPKSAKGTRTK